MAYFDKLRTLFSNFPDTSGTMVVSWSKVNKSELVSRLSGEVNINTFFSAKHNLTYRKVPKFSGAKNFAVIQIKGPNLKVF